MRTPAKIAIRLLVTAGLAVAAVGGPASGASYSVETTEIAQYRKSLAPAERRLLHYLLAWSGDFQGAISDEFGETSVQSVVNFQARLGNAATGLLNAKEIEALVGEAREAIKKTNYRLMKDNFSGAIVGLPGSVNFKGRHDGGGAIYADEDKQLEIRTYAYTDNSRSLVKLYKTYLAEISADRLLDDQFRGDNFTLSWTDEESRYRIIRFKDRRGILKGVGVRFMLDKQQDLESIRMAHLVVSDYAPFDRTARVNIVTAPKFKGFKAVTPPGGPHAADRGPTSFGTGFFVSAAGHVMTNAHVVNGCREILVGEDKKPAVLIGFNDDVDLAVLKTGIVPEVYARFTDSPVRLGEDVAAFGFPLRGILSEELNMTTGNVSSLRGLGGNASNFQFTAPIQAGNSGGPVADRSGRVIGIATSKLSAGYVARKARDVPQLVNFAVTYVQAVRFLRRWGIRPEQVPAGEALPSWKLAADVKKFVLPVVCHQRPGARAARR